MEDTTVLATYSQQPPSSKWLMLIELRKLIIQKKKDQSTSLSREKIRNLINMETEIIESMRNGGKDYFFSNDYSLFTKATNLLDETPILVQQQLVVEGEQRKDAD